jgi:hypothetical protein
MFSHWHLLHICSFSSQLYIKPFISFTLSVSGTTLSVPSVYFISIYIYFINVPHVYIFSCYACFIKLFFRCECGNCSSMTRPEECICCVEVPAVHSQILSEDIFISNCLNRHVLHVSMYEFWENVGPFDTNEPINEYVIIFQHFIQYVHNYKQVYLQYLQWIIFIFMQIIFINIQNLQRLCHVNS